MTTIAALLVGINTYPGCPLRGCVNDVAITRDILVSKYNISTNNIRMVTDNRATKQEILTRLDWLVSCEADVRFFWYSGHGAQVPKQDYSRIDGDEITGMDEVICPVDFNWDGNWIADDHFSTLFARVTTGRMLTVFDCCHSGTMDRDIGMSPSLIQKFIPTPVDILSRNGKIELSSQFLSKDLDSLFTDGASKKDNPVEIRKRLIVPPDPESLVMYAGCKDDQTSADAYINGRYQGALSFAMQKNLLNDLHVTYSDLFVRTTATMKEMNFAQDPVLVGKQVDIPFLT